VDCVHPVRGVPYRSFFEVSEVKRSWIVPRDALEPFHNGVPDTMTALDAITTLEPTLVWKFFIGMAAVPRPSKREEKIREHMKNVVSGAGFDFREDACGNLVVNVPASKGCEKAPIIVLQAHLDMVCEKNAGTKHDFDNDPIKLILDKDPAKNDEPIVRADGTTLGADNGIGVDGDGCGDIAGR